VNQKTNQMKIIHILFASIILSTTITSCSSSRLSYEDVNKELEEAEEAKEEVKIEMQEAIDAREQYYKDYKLTKIEELEKEIKSVDKQISGIQKQQSRTSNEDAKASLDKAITSLKTEKKSYQPKLYEYRH
jgi:chromosome segregation ATPase